MVSKLLIMDLTTSGTSGMQQTLMLLMMGQMKKEKCDVEAHLHCAEFDFSKEEGRNI